jgi:uncharacterized membrane protein
VYDNGNDAKRIVIFMRHVARGRCTFIVMLATAFVSVLAWCTGALYYPNLPEQTYRTVLVLMDHKVSH